MNRQSADSLDQFATNATAAAVRYLAAHGFESTTAAELADAMGMSRSTFFRRFGSKEDVIFIDHELALARLEQLLDDITESSVAAIIQGPVEVLRFLTKDEATARLRWQLVREHEQLRERELVGTHKYERVFVSFLQRIVEPHTPSWVPVALAAGLVAVHNAALRGWLRTGSTQVLTALEHDLVELVNRFSPWFSGVSDRGDSRVIVAAFRSDSHPNEVLSAVSAQLR